MHTIGSGRVIAGNGIVGGRNCHTLGTNNKCHKNGLIPVQIHTFKEMAVSSANPMFSDHTLAANPKLP